MYQTVIEFKTHITDPPKAVGKTAGGYRELTSAKLITVFEYPQVCEYGKNILQLLLIYLSIKT